MAPLFARSFPPSTSVNCNDPARPQQHGDFFQYAPTDAPFAAFTRRNVKLVNEGIAPTELNGIAVADCDSR
jgi:hypothetical protein